MEVVAMAEAEASSDGSGVRFLWLAVPKSVVAPGCVMVSQW
jgi:hypothetical protein